MAGTTINNQKPRTEIWRESYETKVVNDTWGPRLNARRLENEEDKVNAKDHETYRSQVGTLLYLTDHYRPDISNPVRELSKTMDAPAPAHLKEMYKLITGLYCQQTIMD